MTDPDRTDPHPPGGWHAPVALLTRFADDPTSVEPTAAASLEAHLVGCDRCRTELTGLVPDLVATSWAAVVDRIDRPRPSLVEQVLRRVGVGEGMARLLGATVPLQVAGLAVVAVLASGAAGLSRAADATGPFLVLAPLLPLGVVALTFAPLLDPAGEAGIATPMHGFGLLLRRTAAVLAAAFVLLGVAALALPDVGLGALGWVLPGLALSLSAVALATRVRAEVAVSSLAVAWLVTSSISRWVAAEGMAYDHTAPFTRSGQLASVALAAVAAAVVVARRDRFALLEVPR